MGFERKLKCSIGEEQNYGQGASSYTDVPWFIDGRPEVVIDPVEAPIFSNTLARSKFIPGQKRMSVSGKYALKGSGTAGTPPELTNLLKAAGLGATVVTSTSVDYNPLDTGYISAALKLNLDGVQYDLNGARAESLVLTLEPGKPVIVEEKFQALWTVPTAAAISAPTFADAAIVAPSVNALALTIGAKTHSIPKLVVELKNVLLLKESINAANASGIDEIAIMGHDWGGSMTVFVDSDNDIEWWTALAAGTEFAVASTGFGAAGNKIALAWSNLQIEEIKPSAVAGLHAYDSRFRINKGATLASQFSLKFT